MSAATRIAHLRRLFGLKLTDTATITTPGEGGTVDGGGGWVPAEPTTQTVPCRYGPIGDTPQERAVAAKYESLSLWTIKVPVEVKDPDTEEMIPVVVQDTAEITIAGQTYIVIEPLAPRTDEIVRRIVCRRRDAEPEVTP